MCTDTKCLFFIDLRIGGLIFGYFSAIISALGTIFFTIFIMYMHIWLAFGSSHNSSVVPSNTGDALIVNAGYFIQFLTEFIFSVFLLVGITQKKPLMIKTYIIYGMIHSVVFLTYCIILHSTTDYNTAGYIISSITIFGIYTACLYMLFLIYQSMSRNNTSNVQFVNPSTVSLDV